MSKKKTTGNYFEGWSKDDQNGLSRYRRSRENPQESSLNDISEAEGYWRQSFVKGVKLIFLYSRASLRSLIRLI